MIRRIAPSVLLMLTFAVQVAFATGAVPNAQTPSNPTPLTLSINGTVIAISGIAPHGQAYVVGLMRTNETGYGQLSHYQGVLDAAGDGSATFTVGTPIARDSFFFAVDLATGGFGTVTPDGRPVRSFPLAEGALKKANNGQLQKLETHLERASLLLVRPGSGAWELAVGDGGPEDDDQIADGASNNRPEQMHAIGASPAPPKNFRKDDLLFIFAPNDVAMLTLRVKE